MLEIERKFLLSSIPDLSNFKFSEIEQGYISFVPEIRVRNKDENYYITSKSDGTKVRKEIETEINELTYLILTNLIKGRLIKKTRYKIPLYNNLIAELDIYHDELDGLATVEVEFNSEDEANNFLIPSWFGKDVTSDKRYKNKNLAQMENVSILKNECEHKSILLKK